MSDEQTTIAQLRELVDRFVGERDWHQFHTPKNLSMALAIEAAELMEHFQWLDPQESRAVAHDARASGRRSAKNWPTSSATRWRWPTSWGSTWREAFRDKMVKNADEVSGRRIPRPLGGRRPARQGELATPHRRGHIVPVKPVRGCLDDLAQVVDDAVPMIAAQIAHQLALGVLPEGRGRDQRGASWRRHFDILCLPFSASESCSRPMSNRGLRLRVSVERSMTSSRARPRDAAGAEQLAGDQDDKLRRAQAGRRQRLVEELRNAARCLAEVEASAGSGHLAELGAVDLR